MVSGRGWGFGDGAMYSVQSTVGDKFLALVRSCSPRGPICSFRVILHAIQSQLCVIGGLCVAVEVR